MILEFIQNKNIDIPKIFSTLPEPSWGGIGIGIASLFLAVNILLKLFNVDSPLNRKIYIFQRTLEWAIVGLFTMGCFTHFYSVSDEVSVNLEHPYNLFHHGRFSMSPISNVDGTIEVFFYLLHTPFSNSVSHLVLANYLLTLLSTLACIFIAYSLIKNNVQKNPILFCAFLMIIFPIIRTYSTGFGAAFFSALIMCAVHFAILSRAKLATLVAGIFPLIRPDAIIWSLGIQISSICKGNLRALKLFQITPILTTILFYGLFYYYYDHWKPTPVLNKTLHLSGFINMFRLSDLKLQLLEMIRIGTIIPIMLMTLMLFFSLKKINGVPRKVLISTFVISIASIVFYLINGASIGWFGNQNERYFAPSLSVALIAIFYLYISIHSKFLRSLVCLGAIWSFILLIQCLYEGSPVYKDVFSNREWAVRAGYIANAISEKNNLRIATSEMNTFGLLIENAPVIDYWTYTDREIAQSKLCSGDRVHWLKRDNQNQINFDLFWVYFTSIENIDYFSNIDDRIIKFHHFSKSNGYRIGEVPEILNQFDVILIRLLSGETITFLVNKKLSGQVKEALSDIGFLPGRHREVDHQRIKKEWLTQQAVWYEC